MTIQINAGSVPIPASSRLVSLLMTEWPHIIVRRFDHWSRCSTDPSIRRNGRAVSVAMFSFATARQKMVVDQVR
jgi:hypothetical protein